MSSSTLIVGAPGAGKTSNEVEHGILNALKQGQRVVANIPLIQEACVAYLDGMNLDGLIVQVTDQQIKQPNFWFCAEGVGPTITQAGDYIAIDEAHGVFPSDDRTIKLESEVCRAVRLRRKYVGGSKNFSTTIHFLSQSYRDLHPKIREVCDSMYYIQKMVMVGRPDQYRIDVYSNARKSPERASPDSQYFASYDPKVHTCYDSYSVGVGGYAAAAIGQEEVHDKRLNFWEGKIGIGPLQISRKNAKRSAFVLVALSLVALFFVGYRVVVKANKPVEVKRPVLAQDSASVPPGGGVAPALSGLGPQAPATPAETPLDNLRKNESRDFRLVGLYDMGGRAIAVLVDRAGRYRTLAHGFSVVEAGPTVRYVTVGDTVYAPWTGPDVSIQETETSKMESR